MSNDTRPLSSRPLSPRHERFVAEYLKDSNATQAYVRAGYSPRGAQSCASRLLAQPPIAAAIAAGRQRLAQALEITVERLAQEYAKVAFASVDDFVEVDAEGHLRVDLAKASRAQRAGVVELSVTDHGKQWQRVKLKLGKLQALDALARHLGVFLAKPAPGLTAEDRVRYEARIAAHERDQEHALNERRRLERERDEAQIALAAAQARIKSAGLDVPPQEEEEEKERPPIVFEGLGPPDPPVTRAEPRRPWQSMATQAPPACVAGLHPDAKFVWSGGRRPGDPPDSAEALRLMATPLANRRR